MSEKQRRWWRRLGGYLLLWCFVAIILLFIPTVSLATLGIVSAAMVGPFLVVAVGLLFYLALAGIFSLMIFGDNRMLPKWIK